MSVPDVFQIENGGSAENVIATPEAFGAAPNAAATARGPRRVSQTHLGLEKRDGGRLQVKLGQLAGAGVVVLFQKPQGLPNHLASRIVASGLDLGANEFFDSGVRETFIVVLLTELNPR